MVEQEGNIFKLHSDERILLFVRRHWIFLFIEFVKCLFYFLSITIFIWALQYFGFVPDIKLFGVSIYAASNILVYLWALFCWMLFADRFTDYAIDIWVITNKRIIESELLKLFNRRLSTLELQDVEDVTVQSEGLFANLIEYGTLEVQTAGSQREFFAQNISDPVKVQKIIFDAKMADEDNKKDIEKVEFEQISNRVFKERENDRKYPVADEGGFGNREISTESDVFDWADNSKKYNSEIASDTGINIDEKYKKNIANALKTDGE